MNVGAEAHAGAAVAWGQRQGRSPLAQLLHALNQPLTGLQCSMEVALAAPRTPEQYAQGLREDLELTARMRALVGAIREIVDEQEAYDEAQETVELNGLLREALDELAPVAEAKRVRVVLVAPSALGLPAGKRRVSTLLFHCLEAALSLAAAGSEARIESGVARGEWWLRVAWHGERSSSAFSSPELALLVAQAGWERLGAVWKRQRNGTEDGFAIRRPILAAGAAQ